jgi:hypothetical protein
MADMRFSAEEPDRPAAKLVLGDSGSGIHAGTDRGLAAPFGPRYEGNVPAQRFLRRAGP